MKELIRVVVKPNSRKSELSGPDEQGVYKACIKSPAQDGKANLELIKLVSRYFKKKAAIKSGFSSKHKIIILK